MGRPLLLLCSITAIFGAGATPSRAQNATVSVTGTAHRDFMPDTVRVRCRIYAHGRTASSAVKKLLASRSALEARIDKLGETGPKHTLGPIAEFPEEQSPMQRMQAQIMMGGQPQPDDADKDKLKRLAFTLTLEWPLDANDDAARFARIDAVRSQIEQLGLTGADGRADNDDATDDGDEKKPGADDERSPENEPAEARIRVSGSPAMTFIRNLSDDDMTAALKEAFVDAHASAQRLARASNRGLGNLRDLKTTTETNSIYAQMRESAEMMNAMFGEAGPKFDEDKRRPESELSSDRLGPIDYKASVTATFELRG